MLQARRAAIARWGRPMVLTRPNPAAGTAPAALTVQGFMHAYAPEKITGAVRQGDANVAILADEINAAAWPAPPTAGDWVIIDGATWFVQGATPVFDGSTLLGFNLWIRGGEP